eukprot:10065949-Lingulodinium_polyedra.AAC.1
MQHASNAQTTPKPQSMQQIEFINYAIESNVGRARRLVNRTRAHSMRTAVRMERARAIHGPPRRRTLDSTASLCS